MRIGDIVRVLPTDPIAVGRGTGIVTRIGQTIVRVKFKQWERDIACLRADCTVVNNPSTLAEAIEKGHQDYKRITEQSE